MMSYLGWLNEIEISHFFQDEEEPKKMHRSDASKVDSFVMDTKQGYY